ncbi:MAG: hypothetical protein GEV04_24005, partial [Actinophytocola sp.]|nr:hypothetical protein [Actinophytocola sp.]
LTSATGRVPRLTAVRPVAVGHRVQVRMPPGLAVPDLEGQAERLAAYLRLRELRILRDRDNAQRATVTLVRTDPLARAVALPWPLLDADRVSLWEPVPVGISEEGEPVPVPLPERNVLIGGEPGAGKSVSQSMLIAAAALDPEVDLTLFDGNQVEFAVWRPCAKAFVGPSIAQAIKVLRDLEELMDRRYARLLDAGKRKVEPGSDLRLQVVAINELAFYLTMGDRSAVREFASLLRDLVARGRAAGIIVLAATQRPSGDIVPTSLRDLIGFRWALRCATRDASDTILGSG